AERLRVAKVITELPLIAEALEQGELRHSAVRELSRVAVPETEDAWLEAVRGKCVREIEAMVSGHKAGDLPTDPTEPRLHRKTITIEISPEGYDVWRRMHALAAEEHGQRLSDDEMIQSVFRRAYDDGANASGKAGDKAGSPAYKIAIKQCPDCRRAWQNSGGRDLEVDPAVVECASCDASLLGSVDAAVPERTTTTVTPRKREQEMERDGSAGTVPGRRRNVGLDLNHIQYQSDGGSHELSNLTVTSSLHHQAVHFGKLVIHGTAPDHLTFEFRRPRHRYNSADDDVFAPPRPGGSIDAPSPLPCAAPRGPTPRGVGEPSPLPCSVPRGPTPRGAGEPSPLPCADPRGPRGAGEPPPLPCAVPRGPTPRGAGAESAP